MDRNRLPARTRPLPRPVTAGRYPRLDAELSARKWSLADLSRAAGLGYARVLSAVAGYRAPSLETQDRTARALGCKPHEIWQREAGAADRGSDRG